MSNFEYYVQEIADQIRSSNDTKYFYDFHAVKNYVLDILRLQDSYFDHIYRNDIQFGSMANKVRIYNDNELDVLMELRFPAYKRIKVVQDRKRPGFMFLDFSQACCDSMIANRLASNKARFMCQSKLRSWINSIFTNALNNYGNVVHGKYEDYELQYVWRGVAYTIHAVSRHRTFSIDFVPAVKILRSKWGSWHAIPKFSSIPGNMNHYTFMISNVMAEQLHVDRCGQRLRDALCLLQAFRDSKNLPKLRCFHFVNLAIWMARRMGYEIIFYMPVGELFLEILSELCNAFYDGHLPYVWDCKMNLLGNFNDMELSEYYNELLDAYNTLNSYPDQPALSFGRCLSHFE